MEVKVHITAPHKGRDGLKERTKHLELEKGRRRWGWRIRIHLQTRNRFQDSG